LTLKDPAHKLSSEFQSAASRHLHTKRVQPGKSPSPRVDQTRWFEFEQIRLEQFRPQVCTPCSLTTSAHPRRLVIARRRRVQHMLAINRPTYNGLRYLCRDINAVLVYDCQIGGEPHVLDEVWPRHDRSRHAHQDRLLLLDAQVVPPVLGPD